MPLSSPRASASGAPRARGDARRLVLAGVVLGCIGVIEGGSRVASAAPPATKPSSTAPRAPILPAADDAPPPRSAPSSSSAAATCAASAERGQRLRDEGKLTSARGLFVECSQRTCPAVVQRECATWLEDVDKRLPSIVPSAHDARGGDLTDVRVLVDGVLVTEVLRGASLPVDPGPHVVRFERKDGASTAVSIVAREAEQRRVVEATFPDRKCDPTDASRCETAGGTPPSSSPAAASPGDASSSLPRKEGRSAGGLPPLAIATGAVAVVSVGLAAYFGIRGVVDYEDLSNTCKPDCPRDEVNAVRTKFLVATLAGVVGVVALSATVAITVLGSRRSPSVAITPIVPTFGRGEPLGLAGRLSF